VLHLGHLVDLKGEKRMKSLKDIQDLNLEKEEDEIRQLEVSLYNNKALVASRYCRVLNGH